MIVFYCVNPSCRKRFRADEKLAGRLARCTNCNLTLRVPKPDGSPLSLDNDPGEVDAAFTAQDRPRKLAQTSSKRDTPDEVRGIHPALRWLSGILAIATLLGTGYWWLGQPSTQQEESVKTYLRTSDELVEMHKAIASDTDLVRTRKQLFDKAQENLDAWKQIQDISGRKRQSLDDKYENDLSTVSSRRFGLVNDYMSGSLPILVFWGRTNPQGGIAFFESAAAGEYKVLSLDKGNIGATPSKPPSTVEKKGSSTPVDPSVRLQAFEGEWGAADITLTLDARGKGKYVFSAPTGANQITVCFGAVDLEIKKDDVSFRMSPAVNPSKPLELEFVCRLNADRTSLELRDITNQLKPSTITLHKGRPTIPTPKEIAKEKPNPSTLQKQIIGMWVSVTNKSQSIEFLANGTGAILESNGALKVTFYDFVTDDTIQYADSSERVKLKLDGDQLEVTDSTGKAIQYRREKVVEPPPPPSGNKGKTFTSKTGGFSVELPPGSTVDEGKERATVKLKGGSDSFSISWADVDQELLKSKTVDQLLDERRDKLVALLRAPVKSELLNEKKITLNGHSGRALEIRKTGLDTGSFVITDTVMMFRGRLVIANGRMFTVYTLGKPEFTSAKETTQFLESFNVTGIAVAEPPQPKNEPISLQGSWEINRVVTGDNIDIKSDSDKPPSVTFKHDKDVATGTCSVQGIANSPGGKAYLSFIALPANSRFKLDTQGDLLAIDLTPDRGKKLEGICKFEDADSLVICLSTLARPKEFDTTKEPKDGYRVLITLKRKSK